MQITQTEPAEEPITLEEAKLYLKVDFEEDDTLITTLIKAVRRACERYAGISFVTRTVTAYSDNWDRLTELPYGPHQSVTTVTRIAYDDTETELETDQYSVTGLNYLTLNIGRVWRLSEGYCKQRIRVVYEAGFGDAEDVPEDIKLAILKEVAELYENRENSVIGTIVAELSTTSKSLLYGYKQNVLI